MENSTPTEEFGFSENLYRAVRLAIPHQWDENTNRPSSAAFKDSFGLSTDRQWNRGHNECLPAILEKLECRAIVHLTVQECVNLHGRPKYDSAEGNIYHSLILREDPNDEKMELTQGVAKNLSRAVKVCFDSKSEQRLEETNKQESPE